MNAEAKKDETLEWTTSQTKVAIQKLKQKESPEFIMNSGLS